MPIEILPAPDLYLVEFTFGRQPQQRTSILLPATCGLAARLKAWELFPEYRNSALRSSVHQVKYIEIDWANGRTIIVKQKPETHIPIFKIAKPNKRTRKKKKDVETGE